MVLVPGRAGVYCDSHLPAVDALAHSAGRESSSRIFPVPGHAARCLSAGAPKRVLLVSPWLILPIALALGSASSPSGRRALAGVLVLVAGIGWFGILLWRRFYAAPHWVEPWESIAGRAAGVIHAGGVVIGSNPSFFFYLSYLLPTQSIASGASGAGGFAGRCRTPSAAPELTRPGSGRRPAIRRGLRRCS